MLWDEMDANFLFGINVWDRNVSSVQKHSDDKINYLCYLFTTCITLTVEIIIILLGFGLYNRNNNSNKNNDDKRKIGLPYKFWSLNWAVLKLVELGNLDFECNEKVRISAF